jgi:hypothetical protein
LSVEYSLTLSAYENPSANIDLFSDSPPRYLGWRMEADRHVEERTQQPTGVVFVPGHLQHHRHPANSLHTGLPEDRTASTGVQNLSRAEGFLS